MNKEKFEGSDKKCKYLKVIATIFVIIGLVLFVVGVVDVFRNVFSIMQDNSKFSLINDNFNKDIDLSKMFSGITFIGVAMALFIAAIVLFSIYRKKNMLSIVEDEKTEDSIFDKIEKTVKSVSETIRKATETEQKPQDEVKPKQHIYCAYCGSELDESDQNCPSCGATRKFR